MGEITTLLGFDYGLKRIGIAVGQTLTSTASPLMVVKLRHNQIPWLIIKQQISDWQPQALIVGLSTYADGSNNSITKAIYKFKMELEQRYNLPVYLVDETLSSVAAQQLMPNTEAAIDAMAAKIILETWLQEFALN
jgi:putative holliday junction resolvase